jgi:hypothetical protein
VIGEHSYDFCNELNHLAQRWRNRLTFQRSLAEQYGEGHLSIAIEFAMEIGGESRYCLICATDGEGAAGIDRVDGGAVELANSHVGQRRKAADRYQEPVLVCDVKVMEGAQKIVPSSVRFDLAEQVDDIWSGSMYCSTDQGALKSFSIPHTRAATYAWHAYPKASDISSPPCLLRLLPAGAVAGWDSHPLESAALSRRTPFSDIRFPCLPATKRTSAGARESRNHHDT